MTLRLLADENIPASLIRRLREVQGVELSSVFEEARGIDDAEVLRRAVEADAVVLTADHDFGELAITRGAQATGVVLVRVHPIRAHLDEIVAAIEGHANDLPGHFVVISAGRVRLRRLPTGDPGLQ